MMVPTIRGDVGLLLCGARIVACPRKPVRVSRIPMDASPAGAGSQLVDGRWVPSRVYLR